jgi:transcriptional regulator with XRE-family HTH domain
MVATGRSANGRLRRARDARGWSQREAADQLRRLMTGYGETQVGVDENTVGRWERGVRRPEPRYRRYLCLLYGKQAYELGFVDDPEPVAGESLLPSTQQDDPPILYDLWSSVMDVARRAFLRQAAVVTGVVTVAKPLELLDQQPWEQLSIALKRTAAIDPAMAAHLEELTAEFYRSEEKVPAGELLGAVTQHLGRLVQQLRGSPGPMRRRLTRSAGETAALAGWLAFELGDQAATRGYYDAALDTAKEVDDRALCAWVLGMMSFRPSSVGDQRTALALVRDAQRAGGRSTTATTRAWLAGLEAEAHAGMGDARAARAALARADTAFGRAEPGADPSWIGFFDRARLDGMKVSSLMRIEPQAAQALSREALASLQPSMTKKRSIILADLASALAQQGEVEEACRLAGLALAIVEQTQSAVGLQRIRDLRTRLDPWRDTRPVRQLDEQLRTALLDIGA